MIDGVASTRAELLRLRRWPAVWIMVGAWLLLNLTFGYVFPYLSATSGGSAGPVEDALLSDVLPAGVPAAVMGGMPLFGGALAMILGALAVGSGYGWGTWKTVLTQGPGRLAAFGGTIAALALVVVGLVLTTLALDLGASVLVAVVEDQPIALPTAQSTVAAGLVGVMIIGMWTLAGVLVGTLARGPALAVGLGLVWTLVAENLLRGVAGLLGWLEPVTAVLPGTAAGSLAGAVGATPISGGDSGTPGVLTVLAAGPATVLALGYMIVFATGAAALVRVRDVN